MSQLKNYFVMQYVYVVETTTHLQILEECMLTLYFFISVAWNLRWSTIVPEVL